MRFDVYYTWNGDSREVTVDNEALLVDLFFLLHLDPVDHSTILASTNAKDIRVVAHIEPGKHVFNVKTHQIRVARSVNEHTVRCYNTDENTYLQEHGLVSISLEEWRREDCIPVNLDKCDLNFYQKGTVLGTAPGYKDRSMHEMCDGIFDDIGTNA